MPQLALRIKSVITLLVFDMSMLVWLLYMLDNCCLMNVDMSMLIY